MKLLFDENLSPKLPNRLSDLFPNSLHVRDVGMKATVDVPLYLENQLKKLLTALEALKEGDENSLVSIA
jgi:hypothetical protein